MHEIERIRKVYQAYDQNEEWAQRWSIFNPMAHFMEVQREKQLLRILKGQPLAKMKVLDLGCGTGKLLRELVTYGAEGSNLFGLDLMVERLQTAQRLNFFSHLVQGDAAGLPFADGSFDLILQFTMLSSVLDESVREAIAIEAWRVLKVGGFILWYDLKSEKPRPYLRGISARRIQMLFPEGDFEFRSVTLRFSIAARVVRFSWILAELLEKFPLFRSHNLAIIRKR